MQQKLEYLCLKYLLLLYKIIIKINLSKLMDQHKMKKINKKTNKYKKLKVKIRLNKIMKLILI